MSETARSGAGPDGAEGRPGRSGRLRGWRSSTYRHHLAVADAQHILRAIGRFVALSCLLLSAGSVLLIFVPGGPASTPERVATVLVATAAAVAAGLWWVRGWPRERTSIGFVLAAEVGHGIVLFSCADPVVSLLAATWFFLLGDYLTFAHGRRALVAHCVWVKVNLLFYGTLALLEPDADVGFVLFLVVGLTATLIVTRLFGQVFSDALRSDSARSAELAHRDPMTQLLNRRGLEVAAPRLFAQARVDNAVTAVFLIDVDRFKLVNDRHGHLTGDTVLTLLADRLGNSVRKDGLVARTGGEEFVVLDRVHADGIASMAERLRATCHRADDEVPVTVSLGAVGVAGDDFSVTDPAALLADLISRADTAMYAAKKRGGDQVELDVPRPDAPAHPVGGAGSGPTPDQIFDTVMAARNGVGRHVAEDPEPK
ncbi:MAG: GGDEF domain-containing protein [Nakamurella sp.]